MSKSKKVLLIIGGGIAAYKSLELIRLMVKDGMEVKTILTRGGAEFVTPLSVAHLSGNKVYDDMFRVEDEVEMGHIQLSRWADLIVVAPATADLMARHAHGLCDDLAATALLATDAPVLMCPAMNVRMWEHAATQANLTTLKARGIGILPPEKGEMACGEYGVGRLPEPEHILNAVHKHLKKKRP